MQAGKVILELGIQFTHAFLGSLEERAHFLGKITPERISGIGQQVISASFQFIIRRMMRDARKGHQVGDHFRVSYAHKAVQNPGVILPCSSDPPVCFIMEEAQIQMLQLVSTSCCAGPHQVPGSFMRQIIA